jgi:hypothetical protein
LPIYLLAYFTKFPLLGFNLKFSLGLDFPAYSHHLFLLPFYNIQNTQFFNPSVIMRRRLENAHICAHPEIPSFMQRNGGSTAARKSTYLVAI